MTAQLRPPAVPLITIDPYTSCWSFNDNLYDAWPRHWTGTEYALCGMVRIDGTPMRFMGGPEVLAESVRQTSLEVKPTRTIYRFEAGPVGAIASDQDLRSLFELAASPEEQIEAFAFLQPPDEQQAQRSIASRLALGHLPGRRRGGVRRDEDALAGEPQSTVLRRAERAVGDQGVKPVQIAAPKPRT